MILWGCYNHEEAIGNESNGVMGTWAFSVCSHALPADERPSPAPKSATIVKEFNFLNQTGAIPQTTLFTPASDGFFRANVFGEVVVTNAGNPPVPNTGDSFCPFLGFTADTGAIQTGAGGGLFPYFNTCVPVMGTLTNASASAVYFFRAKANTPITFSMMTGSGASPVAPYAYNVYIILERF
jgi:hypothetical protein